MKAMQLQAIGQPLQPVDVPVPDCGPEQVLIRVESCAVCRTDLHIIDGELPPPHLPLVPGHQIVGEIVQTGNKVEGLQIGQRVGVPWLGYTCGHCHYCLHRQENLCDEPGFTGYHLPGGYAEFVNAYQHFVFPLSSNLTPEHTAPLLCAGLIGYRSLRMAGDAKRLGLYGFGAAAHIITQVAVAEGRQVFAFTRDGDREAQKFACELGAVWAGGSSTIAPEQLDAAIIYAPVGNLVPLALAQVHKGGTVVCAGIHMSDIPSFSYDLLWGERTIRSVANLTREDGEQFLRKAAQTPVKTVIETFRLEEANLALERLRSGHLQGSAVLKIHTL